MGRNAMAKPSAAPPLAAPLSAEGLYGRWAPFYDLAFDLPFRPGRAAAAAATSAAAGPNGDVLVVGVGTGLELGLLHETLRVVGIDLSPRMLAIARDRVARKTMRHVKALQVMDAASLEFPEASFDVTLAPY